MTTSKFVTALLAALLTLIGFASSASADPMTNQNVRNDIQKTLGFVPQFFQKLPDGMLPGTWEEMKGLQLSPSTALDGRSKELVGLAVAAQVPCRYCIVAHTEFAKLNGATDLEIREAIALASFTRSMSTLLNGMQVDEPQFRRDVDRLVKNAKSAAKQEAVARR